MRNTDVQLQEILSRADRVRTRRTLTKRLILDGICCLSSLVLLIVVSACLPHLRAQTETASAAAMGSMILGSSRLGYVLIGVCCFALGVSVTLLCLRLRQRRGRGRK